MWIRVSVLFCLPRPGGGEYILDGDSCVIGSYPLECDGREYLALFEVSFRVESICCNGPFILWLYPVYLFAMLTWWWILSHSGCRPGCWRCLSTCPAKYVLCWFSVRSVSFDWESTLVG